MAIKLSLKRKCAGCYQVENDTHLITVEKTPNGDWEVMVEKKTHLAIDRFSKEKDLVQMTEVLLQCFADTKKEAVDIGTDWVIHNL